MKKLTLTVFLSISTLIIYSQIGIGTVGGMDFYQRYVNPEDNIAYPAAGNVVLNFIYGPKIWVGAKKFSFSIEGQVNIGLTSFAINDYKGLGAIAFPVIGKLNFNGLSGFHTGFSKGFSLGAGVQWSKTELYHLSKNYKNKGVKRDFFDVLFAQVDIGVGSFGTDGAIYVRYGFHTGNNARVLNIGMVFNSNKTFKKKMKKLSAPVPINDTPD
ncbi:MAG: hypothetical protein ACM3PT_10005 [Deltaproteobacteria bacterium]